MVPIDKNVPRVGIDQKALSPLTLSDLGDVNAALSLILRLRQRLNHG